MRARLLTFTLTLVISVLAVASIASADVRVADADDPIDATPTLSGKPNNPDIRHVNVAYDDAGSFQARVDFNTPLTGVDLSRHYLIYVDFILGHAVGSTCGVSSMGSVYAESDMADALGTPISLAVVSGYDGSFDLSRVESADGLSVTVSGSSPAIAYRDFNCVNVTMSARRISTASDPYSRYDINCDCWYLTPVLDEVADTVDSSARFIWFEGHRPTKVKSRMRLDPVGGCRTIDLSGWEVTPDKVRGVERSYSGGRMVFEIRRGKFKRTKHSRVVGGSFPAMRHVSPGRYKLRAWYTGDKYRKKSNVVVKTVRVTRC